jgi:hypothetical protein
MATILETHFSTTLSAQCLFPPLACSHTLFWAFGQNRHAIVAFRLAATIAARLAARLVLGYQNTIQFCICAPNRNTHVASSYIFWDLWLQ